MENKENTINILNKNDILKSNIRILKLNRKILNCLYRANIRIIKNLINKKSKQLLIIDNLGKKSLYQIIEALKLFNLKLLDDPKLKNINIGMYEQMHDFIDILNCESEKFINKVLYKNRILYKSFNEFIKINKIFDIKNNLYESLKNTKLDIDKANYYYDKLLNTIKILVELDTFFKETGISFYFKLNSNKIKFG